MTNNIVAIDFNGIKILLDGNTKLLRLTAPTSLGADTTLHNSEDGSNYQVPTGKKATLIYVESFDLGGTQVATLGYADDADGDTNAVVLFNPAVSTLIADLPLINQTNEVPADKYINFLYTSGSNTDAETIAWVVEEDA